MPQTKYQEAIFIPVISRDGVTHQLHANHLWNDDNAPVVVMFHGVIENGRIFYKEREKGLANYLANQGYNVYVVDFRGRGLSRPHVKEHSNFGQHETITEDIPGVVEYIKTRYNAPFHVVCHSYGGVLFSSAFVRYQGFDNQILSLTCFGTKRQVKAPTFERLFKISLVWNRLVPRLAGKRGHFDAKRFKFGDDAESAQFIQHTIFWIRNDHWIDPVDHYDYAAAAKQVSWPKTWHFGAKKDRSMGHPKDVQRFIKECNIPAVKYSFLAKSEGNLIDYGHVDMLTHPMAEQDHFPALAKWMMETTPHKSI